LGTAPGSRTKLLKFGFRKRCHFGRLVARCCLGRHFDGCALPIFPGTIFISWNYFRSTRIDPQLSPKSEGVVPCRNSLDENGMCFLNGLLLLVMPNTDLPGP
jgi:hypothetical protein